MADNYQSPESSLMPRVGQVITVRPYGTRMDFTYIGDKMFRANDSGITVSGRDYIELEENVERIVDQGNNARRGPRQSKPSVAIPYADAVAELRDLARYVEVPKVPVVPTKVTTPTEGQAVSTQDQFDTLVTETRAGSKDVVAAFKALEDRAAGSMQRITADLIAIAAVPSARASFDEKLDRMFRPGADRPTQRQVDEVIIGGGVHAATYAAVRRQRGKPVPLVVEAKRVGGMFAVSQGPAFYLNSRNRPGPIGVPGTNRSLNGIPGSELQPSHLGSGEYQRNNDMAFVVRTTIAQTCEVIAGTRVAEVSLSPTTARDYLVELANGDKVYANRVIVATGIGPDIGKSSTRKDGRVMNFSTFMARMDRPFPLAGMRRVAVVGDGDSGKTVVEALMGQGPNAGTMGGVELDFVEQVDWYGENCVYLTRADYESTARGRYRALGRFFPTSTRGDRETGLPVPVMEGNVRIRPWRMKADAPTETFEGVSLNGQVYDYVINCVGFRAARSSTAFVEGLRLEFGGPDAVISGRRAIATRLPDTEVYFIGPCAAIGVDAQEAEGIGNIPENSAAMFRYVPRTAALAMSLR